jgi:hypothetical protein
VRGVKAQSKNACFQARQALKRAEGAPSGKGALAIGICIGSPLRASDCAIVVDLVEPRTFEQAEG